MTLSNPAEGSEARTRRSKIFTKELSGVTGTFHVGDEVAGTVCEAYFPPGTDGHRGRPRHAHPLQPTTFEYFPVEGATFALTTSEKTAPIPLTLPRSGAGRP